MVNVDFIRIEYFEGTSCPKEQLRFTEIQTTSLTPPTDRSPGTTLYPQTVVPEGDDHPDTRPRPSDTYGPGRSGTGPELKGKTKGLPCCLRDLDLFKTKEVVSAVQSSDDLRPYVGVFRTRGEVLEWMLLFLCRCHVLPSVVPF